MNGLKKMSRLHGQPIKVKQAIPRDLDGAHRLMDRIDERSTASVLKEARDNAG